MTRIEIVSMALSVVLAGCPATNVPPLDAAGVDAPIEADAWSADAALRDAGSDAFVCPDLDLDGETDARCGGADCDDTDRARASASARQTRAAMACCTTTRSARRVRNSATRVGSGATSDSRARRTSRVSRSSTLRDARPGYVRRRPRTVCRDEADCGGVLPACVGVDLSAERFVTARPDDWPTPWPLLCAPAP
jgi:hypothetical protein